ncbi:MAG TPA: AAA family ATPase [Candidatus Fraserbacteria bacterium]|nr:AAA family ATPase [Candidatus Fraserbacteria bacterium]
MSKRDPQRQIVELQERLRALRAEIAKVIVGQEETVRAITLCLLSGGHALLEGVPGLGKTLLVRTLGRILGLSFKRIQFTPDLMPADILGTRILSEDESGRRRFEFAKGPIFAQLLLADEINRATPKTQSALLEAMQERCVTLGNETYRLEEPFMVLATQNPLEMEGTYPLPEAQIDRFTFKILLRYPSEAELAVILERQAQLGDLSGLNSVLSGAELLRARHWVAQLPIAEPLRRYVVRLVYATHPSSEEVPPLIKQYVEYGASPRAGISLIRTAQANAFLDGAPNVRLSDLQRVFNLAFNHRVIRNFRGEAEGISIETLLAQVLKTTPEV